VERLPRRHASGSRWKLSAQSGCRPAQCGNPPVIPDGWVLVPVEPTYHMCEAMGMSWESTRFPDRYKAMIATAPRV